MRQVEGELRKYRTEVNTLLEDLKRAEGCIEDLQAQVAGADEAKQHLADSWQFTASQLAQAELDLQDLHRTVDELHAEVADRDDEIDQLDRDVAVLERALLLAEKARREQFGECTKELRAAERDTLRREKKLRERQQEFAEIRAAIALAASRSAQSNSGSPREPPPSSPNGSSSAEHQQRFREERLCALVEKLLGDVERCGAEIDKKDAVLRGIGEHIAATAQAAAAQSQSQSAAPLPPVPSLLHGSVKGGASVSSKT
jgi:DNA repair exonuclease SbcCD ATPase subunit